MQNMFFGVDDFCFSSCLFFASAVQYLLKGGISLKKNAKNFLITLVLCIVALFSLAGCKNNNVSVDNDNLNNNVSNVDEKVSDNLSRGTWSGDVYHNDFANLTFNLPEGWAIASDEDIANLMDMGVEALNDNQKDLAELAAKNGLYCFVVNNPSTGSNVIALIERPALTITTDFYISNLREQLSSLESMKYTLSDSYEKEIGANKYSAVDATVEDVALEQHYFVRNIDKYFFSIIVTTTTDDDVTAILNCFE